MARPQPPQSGGIKTLDQYTVEVLSQAASHNGRTLAADSGNGGLKLWRINLSADK